MVNMGAPCEQAHMIMIFFEKNFLTKNLWPRAQQSARWRQVRSALIKEKHNFHLEWNSSNILKLNMFINVLQGRARACGKSAPDVFMALDLPSKMLYALTNTDVT